jgi:F-type H+-transporting ATPase subunit epsilon
MKTFQLSVVSPDCIVVDEIAQSLVAPGVLGYFGVLGDHEPFVTQLKIGVINYTDAIGKEHSVAISGGFLEVSENKVIVLADAAERTDEIDRERAMAALERAKKRLEQKEVDVNVARAQAALERATNRLRALGA